MLGPIPFMSSRAGAEAVLTSTLTFERPAQAAFGCHQASANKHVNAHGLKRLSPRRIGETESSPKIDSLGIAKNTAALQSHNACSGNAVPGPTHGQWPQAHPVA